VKYDQRPVSHALGGHLERTTHLFSECKNSDDLPNDGLHYDMAICDMRACRSSLAVCQAVEHVQV